VQRACFLLRVKPELIDEYRQAHNPVSPELIAAMGRAGVRNYSMFLTPGGLLIGYLEAEDMQASLAAVAETEASQHWQERMAPYFEGGSGDVRGRAAEWVERIFFMA
jgi:L-rhamnose mutarotase